MRNPCKECKYYHRENNTCQSKKCATGGDGHVTWFDRLFCEPCVEKGKWIEPDGVSTLICSNCGAVNNHGRRFNYCPNCGCKMEGEQNE